MNRELRELFDRNHIITKRITLKNNVRIIDSGDEKFVIKRRDEDIDEVKVKEALKKAQLYDFVEDLDEGLDTVIGDRGVRLSGGQRQRIGIARALYHNPQILILDEATSSLDNETEAAVMEAIDNFKGQITLIIIAHRLSTIENCDEVYKIEDKVCRRVR